MRSRYTVQDGYKVRITADVSPISASGDPLTEFEIPVDTVPTDTEGRLVLNFNNPTKKDKIYFHRVSGSTLYYYRKDRLNPTITHYENEFAQMNNFADWFNYGFENTDDFGMIQNMGTNKAQILGGIVDYGSGVTDVASSDITELADGTSYAILDYNDGLLKFVTTYVAETQFLLAIIVVTASVITSITDRRAVDLNKNKSVLNDLTDSSGVLAYKGIPVGSGGGAAEQWTVIEETTGTRSAHLGEYIICNYTTGNTTINLPHSQTANKGGRLCVKKGVSQRKVNVTCFSGDTIDGYGAVGSLVGLYDVVTLVSNGDGTWSIE